MFIFCFQIFDQMHEIRLFSLVTADIWHLSTDHFCTFLPDVAPVSVRLHSVSRSAHQTLILQVSVTMAGTGLRTNSCLFSTCAIFSVCRWDVWCKMLLFMCACLVFFKGHVPIEQDCTHIVLSLFCFCENSGLWVKCA